jgi:hypothetical protein
VAQNSFPVTRTARRGTTKLLKLLHTLLEGQKTTHPFSQPRVVGKKPRVLFKNHARKIPNHASFFKSTHRLEKPCVLFPHHAWWEKNGASFPKTTRGKFPTTRPFSKARTV